MYLNYSLESNVWLFAGDRLVSANHNLTMVEPKRLLIGQLIKEPNSVRPYPTHCEIGIGDTAPAVGDTSLQTPVARVGLFNTPIIENNRIFFVFQFTRTQSQWHVKEVGLFGTAESDDSWGSGLLIARSSVSYDNGAGVYDLTLFWRITLG